MAKSILLINGPNLNLLGTREPSVHGNTTFSSVLNAARLQCERLLITFAAIQSNQGHTDRPHSRGARQGRRHYHQPWRIYTYERCDQGRVSGR